MGFLLTYPEADPAYFEYNIPIFIGSGDRFAKKTACLTVD